MHVVHLDFPEESSDLKGKNKIKIEEKVGWLVVS